MEGENPNGHFLMLRAVEDLDKSAYNCRWDFVIVDEVHNYIKDSTSYAKIHSLSKNADNIILLSATPIQQRKEEYLRLLRLIQPDLYDSVTIGEFSKLVEKQNKISRLTHSLLDDIDSELDRQHRTNLYNMSSFQTNTIATTLEYAGTEHAHISLA